MVLDILTLPFDENEIARISTCEKKLNNSNNYSFINIKYINNRFYTEVKNEKYIIQDGKFLRETVTPKSIRTRYEVINYVRLTQRDGYRTR